MSAHSNADATDRYSIDQAIAADIEERKDDAERDVTIGPLEADPSGTWVI